MTNPSPYRFVTLLPTPLPCNERRSTLVRQNRSFLRPNASQGADNTPHRLDFARRPSGFGEDRADRVLRRLGPRRRMEIALRFECFVQMTDHAVELGVGGRRL